MKNKTERSARAFLRAVGLLACLILQAYSVFGQTAAPGTLSSGDQVVDTTDWGQWKRNCSQMIDDFGRKTFFNCAESAFRNRPFHFYAQSIMPGSGVGGGGQYVSTPNFGKWQNTFSATSVITIRQFWMAEVKFSSKRPVVTVCTPTM